MNLCVYDSMFLYRAWKQNVSLICRGCNQYILNPTDNANFSCLYVPSIELITYEYSIFGLAIGLMGRVFANDSGDRGSIPGGPTKDSKNGT